ncbi:hypothetical protein ANO14919_120590 [Xylariales sp. No.14919]|nr:hypothetical protein ANO14919_120590 [Xylariales sp. No.14919]
MSDHSDQDDDLASDLSATQGSDGSETDRGGHFFDIEAEESDDFDEGGDDDDDDQDDDYYDDRVLFSFPQFSRLPPELRLMIWEAVDPYLKSMGRVFEVRVVRDPIVDLWESATLSQQTAPARALLAANKESRGIALQYYPDVIRLRGGRGEVRFNGSNDIISLAHGHVLDYVLSGERWSDKIQYLAIEYPYYASSQPSSYLDSDEEARRMFGKLEVIFYCVDCFDQDFETSQLHWTVSESSKQFYLETFEEQPGLGEDCKTIYCWPDTSLHSDSMSVHEGFTKHFPPIPPIPGVRMLPMVRYLFDTGFEFYHKTKRHYERKIAQRAGSASPSESSEGEYASESEPDDYELDGFVVDSSPEVDEGSSHDEGGVVNAGDHEDSSVEDGDEDDVQFEQDPDTFNGFSPLQEEPDDDEAAGNLPNTTSVIYDVESPDDRLSNASSPEQPRTIAQVGRRKRLIVSSDGEDGGEDGDESPVQTHSRAKKRARVVLSDSEEEDDEEDGSKDGARSEREGSSRLKKRARVVLSDSENEESEGEAVDDDEVTEDEDDDEDEEEPSVSKPTSLLARLRQFRSEVPVSPEGETSNSDEELDEEEEYGDDGEGRLFDAEFPESPGEDGEEEGW